MICTNLCLPLTRVRVSCGHLCEAEAPTEAAAETVAAVWLTEGLLQTKTNQKAKFENKLVFPTIPQSTSLTAPFTQGSLWSLQKL